MRACISKRLTINWNVPRSQLANTLTQALEQSGTWQNTSPYLMRTVQVRRLYFRIMSRNILYILFPVPSPIDIVSLRIFCIVYLNICYSFINAILTIWFLKIGGWPCLIIAPTWDVSCLVEKSLDACLVSAGEVFFAQINADTGR